MLRSTGGSEWQNFYSRDDTANLRNREKRRDEWIRRYWKVSGQRSVL